MPSLGTKLAATAKKTLRILRPELGDWRKRLVKKIPRSLRSPTIFLFFRLSFLSARTKLRKKNPRRKMT